MKAIAVGIALLIAACGAGVHAAQPQAFPTKPLRIVIGFEAGGAGDTVARIVAQKLAEAWKQPVIVMNRPGAGGTIGADLVAKAQPDGYTLFLGEFGTIAVARTLYPKLPYDPLRDFAHVTLMETFPLVLVVPAGSKLADLKQLLAQAKSKAGMLKYSSSGSGTSPHLFSELMNLMAGTQTVHVPYKGGAPSLIAVVSAEVDYGMLAVATALRQVEAGKLRALAVTSAKPTPRLPGVAPIASVLPGYEGLNFHGLHAPAGTPKAVVLQIQQEVARVLRQADVAERLDALAMDIAASSPDEYGQFIRRQIDTWALVVRKANVRPD